MIKITKLTNSVLIQSEDGQTIELSIETFNTLIGSRKAIDIVSHMISSNSIFISRGIHNYLFISDEIFHVNRSYNIPKVGRCKCIAIHEDIAILRPNIKKLKLISLKLGQSRNYEIAY